MKRFLSLLLALAIAGSTLSPAWAAESPLPEPEEIATLSMLNPLLEADGEEAAQSALDALAQAPFEDKLLTLAQIAEYVDNGAADMELLIGFLPYIGEDLRDGLDADVATAILQEDAFSDTFKIYVIDLANSQDNFFSTAYNEVLSRLALDNTAGEELRIYAAHNLDADRIADPVAVYETLYHEADSMENRMLMLKDIGFVEPATARELSLDVLEQYEKYESRIVTMANKAYIRSIDGEQEYIDTIIDLNREMMAVQDADLTTGCLLALSELREPEAVELIFELDSFDDLSGLYKLVDYNMDGVLAYTEEAGIESLQKIVEAAPVEEFIPALEAKLMQRSTTPEEQEILEELLAIVEIANSEVETFAASTSNWDGYAIFRDGVNIPATGIEIDWHAGIVYTSTGKSSSAITKVAHHSGKGYATINATFSQFLDGNNTFKGARKTSNLTTAVRNKILQTCRDLDAEAVGYTFGVLITCSEVGFDQQIYPENITKTRCDGFVEYCYEYNDELIRGAYIDTLPGMQYDNDLALGVYTPHSMYNMMNAV